MISSGETAISTSGDTAVTALTNTAGSGRKPYVDIINEGAAAGFYSIDSGGTYARLPAASAIHLDLKHNPLAEGTTIKVKRVASGTDLSGVYVSAY
jgi:hypothetical protein